MRAKSYVTDEILRLWKGTKIGLEKVAEIGRSTGSFSEQQLVFKHML